MTRRLMIAVVLCAATGCAVPTQHAHQKLFENLPTREQMDAIAAVPAPPVELPDAAPAHEDWRLKGPFSNRVEPGPHPAGNEWEMAFAATLANDPKVRATSDLHCAAREAGQWFLEKGTRPPDALIDFITGRCGLSARQVRFTWVHNEKIPARLTNAQILEQWSKDLPDAAAKARDAGADLAGLWFGREGAKAVMMVAFTTAGAEIAPLPMAADPAGAVVISGRITEPVEALTVAINRGAFGYGLCTLDTTVALPAFKATCAGDPKDANAWVEVSALPPGRLLFHVAARMMVSPSGTPDDAFRHVRYETKDAAAATFADAVLARVNELRGRASLSPLSLQAKQSATAERLAPHYFAAESETHDAKAADTIALGLSAGWDVENPRVRYGTFLSHLLMGTEDPQELVTEVLTFPSGRASLMDPEARLISVGRLSPKSGRGVGAIISTYFLLEPKPLAEEAAKVVTALNVQRALRGLPPAIWTAAPGSSAADAAQLLDAGSTPGEATDFLLAEVARASAASTRGWVLNTPDLDRLKFPDAVVLTPDLAVVVSVGHYRSPQDPWATYVIMLATPSMLNIQSNESAQAGSGGIGPRAR